MGLVPHLLPRIAVEGNKDGVRGLAGSLVRVTSAYDGARRSWMDAGPSDVTPVEVCRIRTNQRAHVLPLQLGLRVGIHELKARLRPGLTLAFFSLPRPVRGHS